MLNATRFTEVAIFLLSFFAVGGFALSAVNWDKAVSEVPNLYSLVLTSTSGQEMYSVYCAGCHGKDGRGKGRSSGYCTVPPADLTQLAQKNKGIYPADRICQVLRHGTGHAPKGQGYMPIWEPLLKSMNADPPGVTEVRIQNLAAYGRTLQNNAAAPRERPTTVK